jgi:hypothetical protein
MLFCVRCGSPAIGLICQNCIRIAKDMSKSTKESKRPCPRPFLAGAKGREAQLRALGIYD